MYNNILSNANRSQLLVTKTLLAWFLLTTVSPSYAGVRSVSAERKYSDENGVVYRGLEVSCTNTKTKYLLKRILNEKQWCTNDGTHCSPNKIELANKVCSKLVGSANSKESRKHRDATPSVTISKVERRRKLQEELVAIKQNMVDIKQKLLELQKKERSLTRNDF